MNNYQPSFMNQPYGMYGMNQMQQPMQPQMQRPQQVEQPQYQPYTPPSQPMYKTSSGLQGKMVDSVDVVKATEIPLDGSVSYFAISDGSAIVTKQLQQDGTSKIVVYKPVEESPEEVLTSNMLTEEDVTKMIQENENELISEVKNDIKSLKKQIETLKTEIAKKAKTKK